MFAATGNVAGRPGEPAPTRRPRAGDVPMAEPPSPRRRVDSAARRLARRHDRAAARAEPRRRHARAGRARRARRAAVPDRRQHHARSPSLASITAIAAIGQALVVITRNVDLSVEAMMGLVAYCVAITLESHVARRSRRDPAGRRARRSSSGMVNGLLVTVFRVPSIVATLGTLSIFRGIDYLIAGSHQVPLAGLPAGLHRRRPRRDPRHPDLRASSSSWSWSSGRRVLRWTAVRAAGLRRREQPGGRRDPRHPGPRRRVRRVHPVRAAGGHRRRDVGHRVRDDQRHVGDRASSSPVVAAVVVGGVNIFGGSGTVIGAALGAYFLGFVANALILVGLSQFWLQAIYGVVILVAVSADALIAAPRPATDRREPAPMTATVSSRDQRRSRIAASLARWETLLLVVLHRADRHRHRACRRSSCRRATSPTCSPPSWRSRSWPCR